MRSGRLLGALLVAVSVVAVAPRVAPQLGDSQDQGPDPLPPPLPPRSTSKEAAPYEPLVPELPDVPWEIPADLLTALQERARRYRDYARRFVCDETARLADYDATGAVSKERVKRYAYLLSQNESAAQVREYRQELAKDGKLRPAEIEDEERFPPAYAWVYLFSDFHAPYFAFRMLGTRFDGFDYVHEIQFRGSSPFTTGKDIRQWEGRVLIDAFSHTPLEILAEPVAQRDRLAAQYRIWNTSMNIMGFRTKAAPFGYRARIQFGLRRDELTFPTELRYDTMRAESPTQLVDVRASTRSYEGYRFTYVGDETQAGDVASP
jgi:hypothetical protein